MKNIFSIDESVKINWFNGEKYCFTAKSVKRQITDLISENLTDSDLERNLQIKWSANDRKLYLIVFINYIRNIFIDFHKEDVCWNIFWRVIKPVDSDLVLE